MRRLAAAVLAGALAACNPGFAPQYRVTDLRILAVRPIVPSTAWADADLGTGGYPADTLRLEALVANPLARAPVATTWWACLPTEVTGLALPPCLDPAYLADPARFGSPEAAARGVLALATVGTPSADGTSIDVPLGAIAGAPGVSAALETAYANLIASGQRCRPYLEAVVVVVVEADGLRQTAVRTVRLSPVARLAAEHPDWIGDFSRDPPAVGYVRNAAPGIAGLSADPASAADCSGGTDLAPGASLAPGRHVLCGRPAAGATQQWWQCGGDGVDTSFVEDLRWQWYATGGTFSDANAVGNVIEDAPAFDRPAEAFTVWTIARDGRGGEAWTSRSFPAAP